MNISVVVTDLGSFKAYKLEHTSLNTPRLELMEDIAIADAHAKLLDKISDQAGRYHAPAQGKWSTPWGERHNIDLEQRKRLVKYVAKQLEGVLRNHGTEQCYFAASKEINHQILEEVEPHLRSKIVKNLPADLTKLEKAELLERFAA